MRSLTLSEGLANLQTLDLSGINLTSLTLSEGLANLRTLNLANNRLTRLTLPEGLSNLQTINLSGNLLTNLSLPAGLPSLVDLDLSDNQLVEFTLPRSNVRTLNLSENQLTSLSLPAGTTSLTEIDLSWNRFRRLALSEGLSNLQTLRLEQNQLTRLTLPEGLAVSHQLNVYPAWNPLRQVLVPRGMNLDRLSVSGFSRDNFTIYDPAARLQITRLEDGVEISWSGGTLQSAPAVAGPWNDVNAISPVRRLRRSSLSSEFFRLRTSGASKLQYDPAVDKVAWEYILPLNGSFEESIDSGGEEDVYRISVIGSGTLTVYSTGSQDLYGHLLDGSGNALASDDDSGDNANFRISHSVSAGTYYVRVRHYSNSDTGNSYYYDSVSI